MLHHFSPTGRIGRWSYFWRVPVLYLLAFACYGLPAWAEYRFGDTTPVWQNLALAGLALCFYLIFLQALKRLHDLDMQAWWLLVLATRGQLVAGRRHAICGWHGRPQSVWAFAPPASDTYFGYSLKTRKPRQFGEAFLFLISSRFSA